ncbi:hypothetical protein [Paenibacillus ihumii]|nr:hypothetical protein [Paenibacillus ihumii]
MNNKQISSQSFEYRSIPLPPYDSQHALLQLYASPLFEVHGQSGKAGSY